MDPGVTCTRAAASDEHNKTENTKGQEEQTLHKTLKRAKTRVTHVSTCSRKDSLCRSVIVQRRTSSSSTSRGKYADEKADSPYGRKQ